MTSGMVVTEEEEGGEHCAVWLIMALLVNFAEKAVWESEN